MTISYCIFRRRFNALIFVSYIVSSQHQRGGMTSSCCKELKETNIPSLVHNHLPTIFFFFYVQVLHVYVVNGLCLT